MTEQARQRLKQEQAAFEQRLRQDAQWFNVRRAAGYGAVIGLLVILGGSMYILLSGQYSAKVTGAAGTAIFVDILGLFVGVWKVALRGVPSGPVEPTTALEPPDEKRILEVWKVKTVSSGSTESTAVLEPPRENQDELK